MGDLIWFIQKEVGMVASKLMMLSRLISTMSSVSILPLFYLHGTFLGILANGVCVMSLLFSFYTGRVLRV